MNIDITKILAGATANKHHVTRQDIAATFIRILLDNEDSAYKIADYSSGSKVMSSTIKKTFETTKHKYLYGIIRPIVITAIRDFISKEPSQFVDLFNDRSKKSEAMIANETIKNMFEDVNTDDITKEEIDNMIKQCLRNPKISMSDDPLIVKLRFEMASKYAKETFNDENKEEKNIIILPPKNDYICPHTQKECCYPPKE